MGQALYRKYRSRALEELIGQEHITSALSRALESGTLSHAYLFSGPRGVGKTSAARILAYAANDVEYGDSSVAMDIIEIDAASNTSVEDVRDLRDKIFTSPARAKYKVYIIDEVHMLSKAAFNALLKTLEEPPAHVIFILATTEAHKLPATIISRTQRFHFRPIETDKVISHLQSIAKADKINIEMPALELIAAHGQGSFRDSISLLDQARNLKSSGTISAEDVLDLLGQASSENLANLESALADRDAAQLIAALAAAQNQGIDAAQLAKQLAARWRQQLLTVQTALPGGDILKLLAGLINVPASKEPYALLEIIMLDTVLENTALKPKIIEPKPDPKPSKSSTSQKTKEPEQTKQPDSEKPIAKKSASEKAEPPEEPINNMSPEPSNNLSWPDILNIIKNNHNTLYSTARMARADWQDNKLILYFRFPFHQKIINQAANRQIFIDAARELANQDIVIECLLDSTQEAVPPIEENDESSADQPLSSLHTITNIFGGGELLES